MSVRSEKLEHEQIGVRIRRLRKNAGLSQAKLGDALGVSFQQIQKYESGQTRVAAERLQQIASVLGANIVEFYNRSDEAGELQAAIQADHAEHDRAAGTKRRSGSDFADAYERIKDPRARYLLAELARVFAEIEQR